MTSRENVVFNNLFKYSNMRATITCHYSNMWMCPGMWNTMRDFIDRMGYVTEGVDHACPDIDLPGPLPVNPTGTPTSEPEPTGIPTSEPEPGPEAETPTRRPGKIQSFEPKKLPCPTIQYFLYRWIIS